MNTSLQLQHIAEAFSSHQFEKACPYLADTIRWNAVGGKLLLGKEQVIDACEQSAAYLAGVQTTFVKFKVIVATDCVVIDSIAEYTDPQQEMSKVSSCDLYEFLDGKLINITSYCVELPAATQ